MKRTGKIKLLVKPPHGFPDCIFNDQYHLVGNLCNGALSVRDDKPLKIFFNADIQFYIKSV